MIAVRTTSLFSQKMSVRRWDSQRQSLLSLKQKLNPVTRNILPDLKLLNQLHKSVLIPITTLNNIRSSSTKTKSPGNPGLTKETIRKG